MMISGNCTVCGIKKLRFIKKQEASGLFSSWGIKAPLSQVPILGPILFWRYKINEMISQILLTGDKFMPEMHLRQPRITKSACGPFTKNKEKLKEFW